MTACVIPAAARRRAGEYDFDRAARAYEDYYTLALKRFEGASEKQE